LLPATTDGQVASGGRYREHRGDRVFVRKRFDEASIVALEIVHPGVYAELAIVGIENRKAVDREKIAARSQD